MARKKARDASLPEPADEHDRRLLADVRTHGWHMVGVPEDDEGPAFAFTVGLYHNFGHPEVLVLGQRVEVMFGMLHRVGDAVRQGQQRFEADRESEEVLDDYSVYFGALDRRHYKEYLGYALWFYRGDGFPALQCVWPDLQHNYPWSPGAHPALAERQPVLFDRTAWPFPCGKNRAAFTTADVLAGAPVLRVCHDADGDWQFLSGAPVDLADAKIVALGEVVRRDASLLSLADLPEGWEAVRKSSRAAWRRRRRQTTSDE